VTNRCFSHGMRSAFFVAALYLAGGLSVPEASAQSALRSLSQPGSETIRKYGVLPLSFEENQGQAAPRVRYLAHGPGYSLLLEDKQATLLLFPKRAANKSANPNILRMRLLHSNSRAPAGEARLPGTVNYFSGRDPAQWRTGIPTFRDVRYRNVYPGIDLTWRGESSRLEFDFEVAAGSNPNDIRLHLDGARRLRLDRDGTLVITGQHETLRLQKPLASQTMGGRTQPVPATFELDRNKTVRFRLGSYDHTRPLLIDPILNYSTYVGPSGYPDGIAVDPAGEAYIAGLTYNGFPTNTGSIQSAPAQKPNGGWSAYVAKLNSTGTALLFATYLSGDGNDQAYGLTTDSTGNVYVVGTTSSTNFPVTQGAYQTTNREPAGTTFIAKIDSTGTQLLYSTLLGGSTRSWGYGVAVDSGGNAYIAGNTYDTDFPVTPGAFQTSVSKSSSQDWTGYVAKLNPVGSALVYSTLLGGSAADLPLAIHVDANGDAFVTGSTKSPNFPITTGAFQSVNKAAAVGDETAFVTEVNPSGTALVYSTFLGGSVLERATSLALDASGNAYVAGYTESSDFPVTPGVIQPAFHASPDLPLNSNVFLSKLSSSGSQLLESTFLSGTQIEGWGNIFDQGSGVAVDASGNVYVTGSANTMDFPVTPGALQPLNLGELVSGNSSSFVAKIDATFSKILYATYLTGTGDGSGMGCDCTSGIALDPSNNVYVAGIVVSSDFPTTLGAFQTQYTGGGYTNFVTEFNASEMTALPATTTTVTSNVASQTFGQPITFTATVQPTSGSPPTGAVGFSFSGLASSDEFPGQMGGWFSAAVDGSGSANYTTTALPPGQTSVIAYYLGDANHAPSLGGMTQTVVGLPTTLTLTSSGNPEPWGTPVVFTATVRDGSGNPVPGNISFNMGNLTVAPQVALNSAGQAAWTNCTGGPCLPVGADTITASYSGYGYAGSSASVTETFTPLGVTPTPTFSPPAGAYTSVQSVVLSDSASTAAIYYTTNGTTPVIGSSPSYGPNPLLVNQSETIEAVAIVSGYSPSSAISAAYVINLPPPNFALSVSPTAVTASSGYPAVATVLVTGQNQFSGTVSFSCSGLPAGAVCTFTPATVTGSGGVALSIAAPPGSARNDSPFPPRTAPIAFAVVLIGCARLRRHPSRVLSLLLILASWSGMISLSACGGGGGKAMGGGPSGIPPTSITTVTIGAVSGSLTRSATLTLTVN